MPKNIVSECQTYLELLDWHFFFAWKKVGSHFLERTIAIMCQVVFGPTGLTS